MRRLVLVDVEVEFLDHLLGPQSRHTLSYQLADYLGDVHCVDEGTVENRMHLFVSGLIEHEGQQSGRIQGVVGLESGDQSWFSLSASARRSWISSSERQLPSGI